MAGNLYFSSVLRIFIQILQKIFKENLARADKCYVLHFYLCAINKERKMKIKTMIVALGISFVMLGNTVFSSEGYLGLQADRGADGSLVIKRVVNGSVAGYAGLKPKDRIIKINGVDLEGLSYERSKNLLKGEAGQPVSIVVEQNGKLKEMKLVRSHNKNGIIQISKSEKPKVSKKQPKKTVTKTSSNKPITKQTANVTYNNTTSPERICQNSYGFRFFREPYNRKVIVYDVIEGSPADRAGIQPGYEIIRVNNIRVKKNDINTLLNADSADFYVRTNIRTKEHIQISKANVCFALPVIDNTLNVYWKQINSTPWENIHFVSYHIFNKLSARGKQEAQNMNYWHGRKMQFFNGYNACKITAKNTNSLEACVVTLINEIKAEIRHEQEQAYQRAMMQMYTNALNNYSYSLRNQHIDVNHYGNVNHDVNLRGRMNVYHY